MFFLRDELNSDAGRIDIAFTDRHGGVSAPPFDSLDLTRSAPGRDQELHTNLTRLAQAFGVEGFATMQQVHGSDVQEVRVAGPHPEPCDGMVTTQPDVALCVRVGDCVPVVLADAGTGVVGVAHAGRVGLVTGIVAAVVERMRSHGAGALHAWVGPHVCGGCYEVPTEMRDHVAATVPASYAVTTWGTPSVDVGAGVRQQLADAGCTVHDVAVCTRESPDLYSHRRDGHRSGRFGGLVVRRVSDD